MALSKILPDVATGDVLQRISTQGETYTSGDTLSWDNGSSYINETTAYNNGNLTPLKSLAVTARRANSKFHINLTGKFHINNNYRSQICLGTTYSAGSFATSNMMFYSHYGSYNSTGGDLYDHGGWSYDDTRNLAKGASRTYHWFGGSIGGGTQKYWNLNMSIIEVAS